MTPPRALSQPPAKAAAVPNYASDSVTEWPTFPFDGNLTPRELDAPVDHEPERIGEGGVDCTICARPDSDYIWADERWRIRAASDEPSPLPVVLILESRSHLDLGELTPMHAAELGVMTVRLERAIRSLDDVGRVHVHRWGDGAAHLHMWFFARPFGQLQLRGIFLPVWEKLLPPLDDRQWRENLAFVAAMMAEYGGEAIATPPPLDWANMVTDDEE